ncbi:Aspartyl protease [Handroanthus impetiginosus]|uniref:Aspartyl protease n=1 Tax=Handroanthus impetiginosus TaxID=429701 RepID=A0A2G9H8S5_9LAMI|nr:Aspartyl protease [Handroanthus impetiginosus]
MHGNKPTSHICSQKKKNPLKYSLIDMASFLTYSLSLMKLLVFSSLLLILVSCFVKTSNAFEGRKDWTSAIGSHFHTVEISSLLPASVCTTSSIKGTSNKRQSTLEFYHRHGPCSRLGQDKANPTTIPSLSEILVNNEFHVKSIQARVNPNSNTNQLKNQKANLPVQSGLSLGTGNYIVTIGLGTPKKTLSFAFDTASDLTWTQCEPCAGSCYKQQDPIFNPSTSTTYCNVSCKSSECSQLFSATGNKPGCTSSSACIYEILYADQSFSVGFFSGDKLTIARDEFPNFLFGCGQDNEGLFGETAGILALGRHPISLISQTAQKYGKYFSYCLPSTPSQTGHLTLGKNGVPCNVKFTPFDNSQGPSFYFINILSITVGGHQLPIEQSVFKTSGCIIDSGTVITRLPPAAYATMRIEFRKQMSKYKIAPAFEILDTCYDLSGYTTITIPVISFTFSVNVKVNLAPFGILVAVSATTACLAFAPNWDVSDVAIFGNTQHKTFEVIYDVAGGKLGFGPDACQ